MIFKNKKLLKTALWFVPTTLAAGVINGLLGAGGGVIMLYVVTAVLRQREKNDDAQKDAFATVVAIILPVSIISALSYAKQGSIDMAEMQILTIPAIVGGLIGAYLTDKLPTKVIRGFFAALVIVSGVRMVW